MLGITKKINIKNGLLKSLIKDTFFVSLFKVLGIVLGFTLNIFLARYYGSETLGLISIILTFISFSSLFVLFGTDTAINKLIPKYSIEYGWKTTFVFYKKIILSIFITSLIIGSFLYFASKDIAIYFFHNNVLTIYFKTISLFIFFISIRVFFLKTIITLGSVKTFGALFVAPTVLIFIVLPVVYFYDSNNKMLPLDVFIFVPIFVSIFSFLYIYKIFTLKIQKTGVINKNKYSFPIKELLDNSFPMFFSSSLYLILSQIDTLIIAYYYSSKEVGLYSVAAKITLLGRFFLNTVSSIIAPKISKYYHSNNIEMLHTTIKNSLKLIRIVTIPVIIVIAILGKFILSLFGQQFVEVYNVLLILLFGEFISAMFGSIGTIINMTNNQHIYYKIILFTILLNICLNIIFVKLLGVVGIAFATTISLFVLNYLSYFFVKKTIKVSFFDLNKK